jgi:hypothetical protein
MVSRAAMMVAGFIAASTAVAQSTEFQYIRKDTRQATREATLAQYRPRIDWGPWHLIGPFDNTGQDKHDVVYPPELGIDLAAGSTGKGGREARWQPLTHNDWDPIDLRKFGDETGNLCAIAYLYREFTSEREVELETEFGSDDGLKLWCNGRLLVDADAYRGLTLGDHVIRLPVKSGRNTLLAKITQGEGNWDFQMRPTSDSRIDAMLEYYLDRDFPSSPEAAHYRLLTILEPEDVVLEVGGLDLLPDGRPVVCTRRGEVWIVENAYADPPFEARYEKFASGLHEPLGLRCLGREILTVQRGELTRLVDENGDDIADRYETVSDGWGVSGNYHEFAFGPKLDGRGRLWVTLNVGFCGGLGKSIVPWRGWALIVNDDGSLTPVCGGLRSPNGLGRNAAGDMFYTDNQGDWVGTNKLSHLDFGDWHGHPSSFQWYEKAGMSTPRGEEDFKPPAVWFPYKDMGQSASDIVLDETDGAFGPFPGQLFVGDQTSACVMRVFLERIAGVYQGACFPFRSGLDCGVNRMEIAPDGSMFVGMTNRGWGSLGRRSWGLQRMVYTGLEPFEVHEMRAKPDGFEVTFTQPVEPATAAAGSSYAMMSYTYERWATYGSPPIRREDLVIRRAVVAEDRRSVRLVVDGLRPRFVHELRLPGVRNAGGATVLHPVAYYTLNVIPAD